MKKKIVERDDEYFKRLYASKRRLKNNVLLNERRVAMSVGNYLGLSTSKLSEKPRLESDLEWLLTWKLKTGCCPEFMWCDGFENLKFRKISKYRIAFKSDVWVGPEDGSGDISKGNIQGEIEVRHTSKQLKKYTMVINHEGNKYIAKKT